MSVETLPSRLVKFVVSYCCFPLLLILTPFARLYSICTWTNWRRTPPCGSSVHSRKVRHVQEQIRAWNAAGRPGKLCTARKPWKTFTIHSTSKRAYTQVDMDDLQEIIDIDTSSGVLKVEPGMNMGRLTSTLLPMGWTVPVVPELDTLTIGGLICGAGLETSSHMYGLFSDTCIAYEVVLPNGEVVRASKDENVDLFCALPMSYGTIGFVTAVELPLVAASTYVRLEYLPVLSNKKAVAMLSAPNTEHDFVEGIMYGPDQFVIMYGRMVNHLDTDINEKSQKGVNVNFVNRWYKPWFYKYVESKLKSAGTTVEYIPLRDYYHRHTRAYFWEAVGPMPYGNHFLFRYLFGWVFPLNFQIIKLLIPHSILDLFYVQNHVVQDFVIPIRHLPMALRFLHDLVHVYPLWLCPSKAVQSPGMAGLGRKGVDDPGELFVDIGVYGDVPHTHKQNYDHESYTRKMEEFTIKVGGYQALYADSYLSREQFAQMFDTTHYQMVRRALGSQDAFPDVYDKISRQARR